jgi:hypothetical protein
LLEHFPTIGKSVVIEEEVVARSGTLEIQGQVDGEVEVYCSASSGSNVGSITVEAKNGRVHVIEDKAIKAVTYKES